MSERERGSFVDRWSKVIREMPLKSDSADMIEDQNDEAFQRGYRDGFLACREAAAKVARGDVFKERYRTWPFRGGDRSNENEITRHSDDIANAIEALTPGER